MKTLIYLFAFLFLFSCTPKEIHIEERSRYATQAQSELLGPLVDTPQHFNIDLKEAQLIKGEQGTHISIPKGAFVNKKGYYFAYEDYDYLIKLPPGEKTFIVAMTNKGDTPIFAMESFEIKDKHHIELMMKPSTHELIKERLKVLE